MCDQCYHLSRIGMLRVLDVHPMNRVTELGSDTRLGLKWIRPRERVFSFIRYARYPFGEGVLFKETSDFVGFGVFCVIIMDRYFLLCFCSFERIIGYESRLYIPLEIVQNLRNIYYDCLTTLKLTKTRRCPRIAKPHATCV